MVRHQRIDSLRSLRIGDDVLYPTDNRILIQVTALTNAVVAEIAGPDSVAAVLAALECDSVDTVIPTAVYVPTEYGDVRVVQRNVSFLRRLARQRYGKRVLDLIWIGSASLWAALNGYFVAQLLSRFGYYSPCPGCHLYVHAVRVPLAKAFGCRKILAGEREIHESGIKLNQIPVALESYDKFLKEFGIELWLPLRYIDNQFYSGKSQRREDLLSATGLGQLRCAFSRNYILSDGRVTPNAGSVNRFFEEFAIPLTQSVVDNWLNGRSINPRDVAAGLLGQQ